MRITNILAVDFAALVIGVAIPATPQSDDVKDVGPTPAIITAALVTHTNDNTTNATPPWNCGKNSYNGVYRRNDSRMIKCCIQGHPLKQTEKTESTTTEGAVVAENDIINVKDNACRKSCSEGFHCSYCGFSGRYSIECCKVNEFPSQSKKVDTLIRETAIQDMQDTSARVC
jgi:hypothetical protein